MHTTAVFVPTGVVAVGHRYAAVVWCRHKITDSHLARDLGRLEGLLGEQHGVLRSLLLLWLLLRWRQHGGSAAAVLPSVLLQLLRIIR